MSQGYWGAPGIGVHPPPPITGLEVTPAVCSARLRCNYCLQLINVLWGGAWGPLLPPPMQCTTPPSLANLHPRGLPPPKKNKTQRGDPEAPQKLPQQPPGPGGGGWEESFWGGPLGQSGAGAGFRWGVTQLTPPPQKKNKGGESSRGASPCPGVGGWVRGVKVGPPPCTPFSAPPPPNFDTTLTLPRVLALVGSPPPRCTQIPKGSPCFFFWGGGAVSWFGGSPGCLGRGGWGWGG